MKSPKMTFHWSNYFKPTLNNLQYWTEGIQGILALIAADQFFLNSRPEFAFYLMLAAGVLDKVSKFFAKVANDYRESVTVEYPAEIADQIVVTKQTDTEDEETKQELT